MPIPVSVVLAPLPINDDINAAAELALSAFVRLMAAGTSGSATVTPPVTTPVPNSAAVNPVVLSTAADQLFVRHTMLAIIAAALPITGRSAVPTSATSVTVPVAAAVGATSKVFITPLTANTFWFGATGYWVNIVNGSFSVNSVNAAAGSPAQFSWMLVP